MDRVDPALEISPAELARQLEAQEAIQILDVRAPARVAGGRIDLLPEERFINLVGSRVLELSDLGRSGLVPDLPTAVVCGLGNDSLKIAQHLQRLGGDARSLKGGMTAWMGLAVPRDLEPPPGTDRLVQLDRIGKGALGYVLISDGEALIIDPPRDYSGYLELVAEAGARVAAVADTHVHADYISGAPRLAAELRVPYYLQPLDAVYPYDGTPGKLEFTPIEEGSVLSVGRCRVEVEHNPGHTEGSVTLRVGDAAAFTGDFIFIGSIGRPDLAGKTEEWTAQLWSSLERSRGEWSETVRVYPAHYASEAERRSDRSVGASFGELLRRNEPLKIADAGEFQRWVEERAGAFPEAYRKIKAINVGLLRVGDKEAEELEVGRNECALGGA
jgi:glyoxylase-like metal-dependent hydrolase (beta-lactamase superfamily II)